MQAELILVLLGMGLVGVIVVRMIRNRQKDAERVLRARADVEAQVRAKEMEARTVTPAERIVPRSPRRVPPPMLDGRGAPIQQRKVVPESSTAGRSIQVDNDDTSMLATMLMLRAIRSSDAAASTDTSVDREKLVPSFPSVDDVQAPAPSSPSHSSPSPSSSYDSGSSSTSHSISSSPSSYDSGSSSSSSSSSSSYDSGSSSSSYDSGSSSSFDSGSSSF